MGNGCGYEGKAQGSLAGMKQLCILIVVVVTHVIKLYRAIHVHTNECMYN